MNHKFLNNLLITQKSKQKQNDFKVSTKANREFRALCIISGYRKLKNSGKKLNRFFQTHTQKFDTMYRLFQILIPIARFVRDTEHF